MSPRRPPARRSHAVDHDPAITLRSGLDLEADEPDRRALGSLASGAATPDRADDRWVDAAAAALDLDSTREFWGESTGWRDERGRNRTPRASRRARSVAETPIDDPRPARTADDTSSIRARRASVRADGSMQRTRSHRVIDPAAPRPDDVAPSLYDDGEIPQVPDATRAPVEHRAAPGVDPLLLRLGAIIAVGVLLVPVVLAMRASASPHDFGLRTVASGEVAELLPLPAVARTASLEAATEAVDAIDVAVEPSTDPTTDPATDVVDPAAAAPAPPAVVAPDAGDEPAAVVESAAATNCAIEYTVGAGDYWLRLADESGVPLADLLRANSATIETPLYPGDDVCLPDGAQRPSPPPAPSTAPASVSANHDARDVAAPAVTTSGTTPPAAAAPPAPTTPPSTAPATTAPATTAPPTTAPAPTAPPASPDQVRQIIREVWPEELQEKALEVAGRESGFRADAYNGWCCYGVFQIYWNAHRSWLAARGVTSASQLYDARTNIEIAYEIYQRSGGWGPWSQTAY